MHLPEEIRTAAVLRWPKPTYSPSLIRCPIRRIGDSAILSAGRFHDSPSEDGDQPVGFNRTSPISGHTPDMSARARCPEAEGNACVSGFGAAPLTRQAQPPLENNIRPSSRSLIFPMHCTAAILDGRGTLRSRGAGGT